MPAPAASREGGAFGGGLKAGEDGPSPEETEALARLIGRGLLVAMTDEDMAGLEDYLAAELPRTMDPAPPASDPRMRALVAHVTWVIWNAAPLPSAGFRPRPARTPERNEPCPCGSGAKFKKCCGAFSQDVPSIPADAVWETLAAEIEAGPAERLLETAGLPPGALAPLARRLADLGRAPRALELLRKSLAGAGKLDDRYLDAVVLEVDLELDEQGLEATLGRALKRVEGLSPALRGAVVERLVPGVADSGDLDRAWALLRQVQRETPESPGIAHLEVMLCLVEGALSRAADRARFWLAWMRRRGLTAAEEMKEAVEFLELAARDPEAARAELEQVEPAPPPCLKELQALVAGLGARPIRAYGVQGGFDGAVLAVPPEGVAPIEAKWAKAWPVDKPLLVGLDVDPPPELFSKPDRWLGLLRRHPEAFDSLDVLDDLALAAAPLAQALDPALDATLLAPLLERACAIVRASLPAGSSRMPWGFLANRPALRLVQQAAVRLDRLERAGEAASLFEWMLEINPNDNHGNRAWLVNHRLRAGHDEGALEVALEHEDGALVDLTYGKALALWRLGRQAEAAEALRAAVADSPRVRRALLAPAMEQPECGAYGVEVGGEEEAWLYREEMRKAWLEAPGAIDLLASVPGEAGGKRKRKAGSRRG